MMYSLIVTCKLNDVDPQAWLTDASPASPSTLPQARRAAAVAMEGYEHVQRVRSRGLKTADLSYQRRSAEYPSKRQAETTALC